MDTSTDLLIDTLAMDDFAPDIDLLDDILGVDYDWKELEPSSLEPTLPNHQGYFVEQKPIIETSFDSTKKNLIIPNFAQLQSIGPAQPAEKQRHLLPHPGTNQSLYNLGFCQPVFSSPAGQTIILPQLQLALVQSDQNQDKLPMKRLAEGKDNKELQNNRKKPHKEQTIRRSSHNAIERRYRSSINDKILELKNLVCRNPTDSEKVHKAAILRNSIDTIRYLQNSNSRLDKENKGLKSALAQAKKCVTCGADQPVSYFNFNTTADLRGLLDNSPPPTDQDSSNPPTPNSVDDRKSPIALFAIAAGLFLLNPETNFKSGHVNFDAHSSTRSESASSVAQPYSTWTPRLLALIINLLIFICIYYFFTKLTKTKRKSASVYTPTQVQAMTQTLSKALRTKDLHAFKEIIKVTTQQTTLPTMLLKIQNTYLLWKTTLLKPSHKSAEDQEMDFIVGKCYVEIGKAVGGEMGVYCGLKGLEFGINCLDRQNGQNLFISALLLTRSKLILKSLKIKSKHPLLQEGMQFFIRNMDKIEDDKENVLTRVLTPTDPVSQLMNKYKYEMMWSGVSQLFYHGEGAVEYFKHAVRGVLCERGTETDIACEWWACVLWSQAEWMGRGGSIRGPVLLKLYKVVDSLFKHQMEDPLCRAVYYTHLAKRLQLTSPTPTKAKRLVDSAGSSLRDAINLTTDKPKPVIQLVWALTAEWILEIRLELWEALTSQTDVEFTKQFSRDLDTLRSLTHYVPNCLPSVYLYEASLRLMTRASPGRTQQLLDASLRSIKSSNRSSLICNHNNMEENNNEAELNCNRKKGERNLIREKRKAMALYLRCKHLPSQVMTCPGEKVGMLREALKGLDLVGDTRKIRDCLEMIKSLQGVSLY